MPSANIYLNFNGNCKKAFDYYQSIFGGEFVYVGTYGEMPPIDGAPPISEEMKDWIMHITLPIGDKSVLMGSDVGGEWAPNFILGNNFAISLDTSDKAETDRLFKALSEGGKITMPVGETFWQSYFGSCTDKFGVNWMISCPLEGHKSLVEEN